jgi:hypothetical protein
MSTAGIRMKSSSSNEKIIRIVLAPGVEVLSESADFLVVRNGSGYLVDARSEDKEGDGVSKPVSFLLCFDPGFLWCALD